VSILLASKGQILKWSRPTQYLIPIDVIDEFSDFCWGTSGCVNTADEATHAGSRYVTDGYAMFLHPSDDSNVSESQRATAFEDQAKLGACGLSRSLGKGKSTCHQTAEQKQGSRGLGMHGCLSDAGTRLYRG
jgi:hypothetical protein